MSKKKTVAGSPEPVAGSETERADPDVHRDASQPATGYGLPATNQETTITREDATNPVPAMEEDAAHGELRRANAALHAAKSQYADAKEVAKDKRKNMDGAQERVNAAVDRICGIQVGLGPLFETEDDDEDGDEDDDQVEEGRGGDLDWVADDDEEAWRAVRLDSLARRRPKPATLRALAEHEPPIVTMGDLANWQAVKGDFWAKDIRGIGPAAEGEIAEAAEAHWEQVAQAAKHS